ncbi:MAG TPA: type IV pilin [Methanolinea sp.]|nr:type IV pilin [Methanolinea sp.]
MSSERYPGNDSAVSPVVGEMLMLALVLILMAVFAATATNVLPAPREPSVNVLQGNYTAHVFLHHKGGDVIQKSEIRVVVNETALSSGKWKLYDNSANEIVDSDSLFDLGGYISIPNEHAKEGDRIKLATSRSVIFTGVVP